MSKLIKPNRRTFIKTVAGSVAVLSTPAIWTSARAQDNVLTVGGSGGANNDVYNEAFYQPYFEETGIQVIAVERRENPLAEVRAVVETGTYKWDFCEGIGQDVAVTLAEGGYLEELDLSGATEDIPDSMKSRYFINSSTIAFLLAYRTDTFPQKMTYADMWKTEELPGRRGLRQSARESLSVALVADGVAAKDVSTVLADEAGWERAFAKLDEIKDEIAVWWTSAGQTPTLLQTAEVDICPTFNTRAQPVIDTGTPVAVTWDDSYYNNYGWVIPKGSPKADMIREFIKYCSNPEQQAVAAELLGTGPSNPSAIDFVDPERARILPTHPDNISVMAQLDYQFWGPRQEEATNRFNDWLLG
ncbi:MAG: extracellular solute-binding protein [Pelagibacterium sp.]|uniref:extracellular solute-binding protein n=1 Tax=Pelagibacterium sp. TaxID=1967288 RepID=UPI0032EF6A0A